jgi:hypothetical protein
LREGDIKVLEVLEGVSKAKKGERESKIGDLQQKVENSHFV